MLPHKGDVITIIHIRKEEFPNAPNPDKVETFVVGRFCKRHIILKSDGGGWCMPYDRVKDIISINGINIKDLPNAGK